MPVFKVWTPNREQRKMVVADSLKSMKEKAKLKLELVEEPTTIVLEEDGTIVDEDEILLELKDKVFVILTEGQHWIDPVLTMSANNSCIIDLDPSLEQTLKQSLEANTTTINIALDGSDAIQQKDSADKNCDVSDKKKAETVISLDLPLPEFSLYVKQCLRNKESGKVWSKAIEEAANFYLMYYPSDVDNQSAYRAVGLKMFKAFPDIKRDGEHPWSTFTRALSQKMRATRLQRKRKSLDYVKPAATTAADGTTSKYPKKFRSGETTATKFKTLPEEEYERHVVELQREHQKATKNESHLKLLLRESFNNRREWIKGSAGGKVKHIIEKFPCLESGKYIWEEFKTIMAEELQMKWENIEQKLEKVLGMLAKHIPKKDVQENEYRIPSLLKYLCKETAFDKGKGEKSSTFIKVLEDIEESKVEKQTTSHDEEGPKLVLFLKADMELEMAVVATDGCRIYCQSENVEESILILMGSYYVFDLDYPRRYSQTLGFLQQFVFGDAYTGEKSTKYKHFVKKVQNDLKDD